MRHAGLVIACLLLAASVASEACPVHRSSTIRAQFQRAHPCPSTGKRVGACPGYTADHLVPLCRGGLDKVSNLQWQSKADALRKDRTECRP